MARRWIPFVVAAACGASLVAAPAADAAVPARSAAPSSSFTAGAGQLPKLKHLGSTKMRVVVPSLPCTKKTPDAAITFGMFGSIHHNGKDHAWSIGVRVSCTGGHRKAVANFNGFTHGGMHVHTGDVMVFKQSSGTDFSVADVTAGRGFGGATGTGPGKSTPNPQVLFGGQLTGHLDDPVTVSVTNAEIHGKPFGKQKWVGQQQVRSNGKVVGDPGPVSKDGRKFPVNFS
jgi:hypothetical protein